VRRRLLELGYAGALLRYAAYSAGLIYGLLLLFVGVPSALRGYPPNAQVVRFVTEFVVFIVPSLCAVQGVIYFGNASGRMRVEWRPASLAKQLFDFLLATGLMYIAASIVFRALSLAFPDHPYPQFYILGRDLPATCVYLALHSTLALLVALGVFSAAVFFGSSFRHPTLVLAYLGIAAFTLWGAWQFLIGNKYLAETNFSPELLFIGFSTLIALPLLFVIPVLLTAIQRTSDGWRVTFVVAVPLITAIVCLSLAMRWVHQRSLMLLRRCVNTEEPLLDDNSRYGCELDRRGEAVSLDPQALVDGFNRADPNTEATVGIDLVNNLGDIVTLLPDGSMSTLLKASTRPTAHPLSGNYPLGGEFAPNVVIHGPRGIWILGNHSGYWADRFLRFADSSGVHEVHESRLNRESAPRRVSGIRPYAQGVLVALGANDENQFMPESLPRFYHYLSSGTVPVEIERERIRERSPLNGLKIKVDRPVNPLSIIWTDSQGSHECPLPGALSKLSDLKVFASVLHGEPFLWIANSGFANQVPFTICHRAGVITPILSADAIRMDNGSLVVTAPDRLWLIRSFAQGPTEFALPADARNGELSPYPNTLVHVDETNIWYTDGSSSLINVDIATGNTRFVRKGRNRGSYFPRRDGLFIQEYLEWAYVPWHGRPRNFGVLFPPRSN